MKNITVKDRLVATWNNLEQVHVTGSNAIPFANGLVILDGVIKELEKQEREAPKENPKEETKKDEDNIQ